MAPHVVERQALNGGIITVGVDISPLKLQVQELARNESKLVGQLTRAREPGPPYQRRLAREAARTNHKGRRRSRSRAKSTFLANTRPRELRTPLSAVIVLKEIIAKKFIQADGNGQYKQYSNGIYDGGNHLFGWINDILDMAEDRGRQALTLSPKPLDPSVAIEQAACALPSARPKRKVSISLSCGRSAGNRGRPSRGQADPAEPAVKRREVHRQRPNAWCARGNAGADLRVVDRLRHPTRRRPALGALVQNRPKKSPRRNNHGTGLGLALTKVAGGNAIL